MFEMCLKQNKASPALKLLRIAKSVDKRQWWFQTPLRQFEGELKANVLAALESRQIGVEAGYDQFEATISLLDMQAQEVGQLCHWQKGGAKIQQLIRTLPNIEIDCAVLPVTNSVLRFHVTLKPHFKWQTRWHGGAQSFWMWIEDGDNNRM
jgi:activating signal cointegrator complex subunit 3